MEEKENLEQEKAVENTELTDQEQAGVNEGSKDDLSGDEQELEDAASERLVAENKELKEKYLRLYSEFENYRRRTAKERQELITTASQGVISEMLPVLDDFERGIKLEESAGDGQSLEGKKLIYNKMLKVLKSKGLIPMEELVGKEFDAEMHEAITQIPAPSEELKGKIVDVIEPGYLLGEKVIRYAKVVIGQ